MHVRTFYLTVSKIENEINKKIFSNYKKLLMDAMKNDREGFG